ncbi:uncharacterized protein PITG_09894 [Phytophthora infestans T30-4]|uniref:Uncharacterized protein n=1 Tax=Phytophthora infestans (strain T30-4) TaxID=403677 RepID=D0NEU1_PHYIT|nr:uncharacterized protein PITG_09894 [Phytophthora infestans T30-4]EEY56373.1 conserved hypothetical protein [Phytophthora infestans T30-4]|eukprot:XP_002902447.1 conserved hypothetical protein [Phytophthora infestans T30-4]
MKLSGGTIRRSIRAFVEMPTKNGFLSEPFPTRGKPSLSSSHVNVKGSVMSFEWSYACWRIHLFKSSTRGVANLRASARWRRPCCALRSRRWTRARTPST